MEVSGGYYADEVSQKSPWTQAIACYDLTPKQKLTATEIIGHLIKNGEILESRQLSSHAKSGDFWPSAIVSRLEMRRLAEDLAKRGVCSYRYTWYMVHWLIRAGWLDEDKESVRGRKIRGYVLSDRVLRYHAHMMTCVSRAYEIVKARRERELVSPRRRA
jgi:hypothetical protein